MKTSFNGSRGSPKSDTSILDTLKALNEWWITEKVPSALLEEKRRDEFKDLLSKLNDERITAIIGPRRTGKTTLLHQVIQHLIDVGTDPKTILFFTADDPSLKLATRSLFEDVFQVYFENVIGTSMREKKVYILIDEIHFYGGWEPWLKKYYDLKYPWKFIITGSSATHISKKSKESLLGRISEIRLLPLDFKGYLSLLRKNEITKFYEDMASKKPDKTKTLSLMKYEDTAKRLFRDYLLWGGFPESLKLKTSDIRIWQENLHSDVLQKTLYRDIVEIYGVREPSKLEEVFTLIAYNTSSTFSYSSISRNLGISIEAVTNYVKYLLDTYLIGESPFFSKNLEKRLRANKKYFILDPGLQNAIVKTRTIEERNIGLLIESVVQKHIYVFAEKNNASTYYWKEKKEVDIILDLKNKIVPLEVKYQGSIAKGDSKGLLRFMEIYKISEGILITKDTLQKQIIDEKTILFIPAWLFLLTMDLILDKNINDFI